MRPAARIFDLCPDHVWESARKGTALDTKAAETQGKGSVLDTETADTKGKCSALDTKAVEIQGKSIFLPWL